MTVTINIPGTVPVTEITWLVSTTQASLPLGLLLPPPVNAIREACVVPGLPVRRVSSATLAVLEAGATGRARSRPGNAAN